MIYRGTCGCRVAATFPPSHSVGQTVVKLQAIGTDSFQHVKTCLSAQTRGGIHLQQRIRTYAPKLIPASHLPLCCAPRWSPYILTPFSPRLRRRSLCTRTCASGTCSWRLPSHADGRARDRAGFLGPTTPGPALIPPSGIEGAPRCNNDASTPRPLWV
ncbi:hypothetical protein ARMGADRAFT_324653 [Armillaria gallica]|uniref:Uncharacterized protein n=1 Tax=Armillaria gallica TaxID=47427 RepID=A0A2H3D6Z9_ARMGA|nr:hypothetical protein ARMGADRAFT_324653 [Armillaria gallica]